MSRKRLIQFYDDEDHCTYTLSMSPEDMLTIFNMPELQQRDVNLPSIKGTASLRDGVITIMHQKRKEEFESICISIEHAKAQINAVLSKRASTTKRENP